MTDEGMINAAIQAFNATMKPLAISYPASVPREFDYYDKELHATEQLAQKLEMSAEFNQACIDADSTNSRQPLSNFQLILFNKFKAVWTEEHKEEIFQNLEADRIRIAMRNKEISRIAGLFTKHISSPMVKSFYTELSEAGMELTQEQIQQYVINDLPIVAMLEQVRSMFDGRMDEPQDQLVQHNRNFGDLERLLVEETGQSSSSCSL